MSISQKNTNKPSYYSGGFAEIVSSPSPLTYKYFKNWFTGSGSIGKAMDILHLPYQKTNHPILEYRDNSFLINLNTEEETLYKKTVFKYKYQTDMRVTPQLSIGLLKIFHPVCLINTIRIILVQSKWIANPAQTVEEARKLIDNIPPVAKSLNTQQLDQALKDDVWPAVIAIGLICEFYNQLILKESGNKSSEINQYISSQTAENDWFFRSITDQQKVKLGQIKFSDYINNYGLRADIDYELTFPRWHEIPDTIKKRIDNYEATINTSPSMEGAGLPAGRQGWWVTNQKLHHLKPLLDASINLHILRSEAKKKVLTYFDELRTELLKTTNLMPFPAKDNQPGHTAKPDTSSQNSGKGICVSQGSAEGKVLHIIINEKVIPQNSIGIFPNASPEFALQYPKCIGMIFLKGGQTSHGSIVAREFGIPAIIDPTAASIKNGDKININGTTGDWKIMESKH